MKNRIRAGLYVIASVIGMGVGVELTTNGISRVINMPQTVRDLRWDRQTNKAEEVEKQVYIKNISELPKTLYVDSCPESMQGARVKRVGRWMIDEKIVKAGTHNIAFLNYTEDEEKLRGFVRNAAEIIGEGRTLSDYVDRAAELNGERTEFLSNPRGRTIYFPQSWKPLPEGEQQSMKCPDMASASDKPLEHYVGAIPDRKDVYIIPIPRFSYFRISRGEDGR